MGDGRKSSKDSKRASTTGAEGRPPAEKKISTDGKSSARGSKDDVRSRTPSEQKVKVIANKKTTNEMKPTNARQRRVMERVEMLARPNSRRLRSLWDEKCAILPPDRRDKIKSALEEDYFLSPEQTEMYFQSLSQSIKNLRNYTGPQGMGVMTGKDKADHMKELRQRQKWLVSFSAQVAYRLCDYIAKGQKEILVSNRLRSIADVVLERVAEILGEPKPTRTHPGRLQRFMVAISDRIAVWIENAVYRADALEPSESYLDDHIRLDAEKPLC